LNSFDLLRLLAALAVIFHHVAPLRGQPVHRFFATDFGALGVGVFFVISGYLVCASWQRQPQLWPFLKKRLLRIEPGLIVSLAVTALALGAFATTLPLAEYLSSGQVWLYVARNALLYPVTYALPGVFTDHPLPAVVNGSLWTLRLEFSCYLAVAALGLAGALTPRVTALLALLAGVIFLALHVIRPELGAQGLLRVVDIGAQNSFLFLAGATLSLWPRPVPVWASLALALLLVTPAWIFGLPALVIMLGNLKTVRLPADASYGLYIYAFPLQQILAGAGHLSFLTALAVTLPFALASWFLVEKPALRFKPGPYRTAITSTSAPLTSATSPTPLPIRPRDNGET
jgi:peptidoglycan/LPS O-acetylase OafA/YrhL